jgi:hypothetical protein
MTHNTTENQPTAVFNAFKERLALIGDVLCAGCFLK